jgi:hypothetical protein
LNDGVGYWQEFAPFWQNDGAAQVVRFVVEQSVFVWTMVWPLHDQLWVQETVRVPGGTVPDAAHWAE